MVNLQPLFEIQKELDDKIIAKHGLFHQNLIPKKILALEVELGELANETRCFKFWSIKPPSPRDIILEEYVDALHFVLSIGLEKGFDQLVRIEKRNIAVTEVEAFHQVFDCITRFAQTEDGQAYQALFQSVIDLGQRLGFSWEEIEQAYKKKNEVNHQRQEQGY
ncbi:dimeric dUTPase (all-alpha-NTP-PPase superfamily) [Caldalkalibacillus uzonensis]|uniref:Dimeric dUTPase (All-alpha-NTP-PPase superfamily) n=1 Tax=Caldalkalibacillus uzonensis TaxID=353224 RepID=A0ABU0CSK6_9BACI|nr:dUTP diphosphatase [Caldalkalibacillus uzonensis]MDQ0338012.1 dimeric dUTPase (all-alpha-NTP-PPase superfamily) [Caldalkalibacillus uzonensis]